MGPGAPRLHHGATHGACRDVSERGAAGAGFWSPPPTAAAAATRRRHPPVPPLPPSPPHTHAHKPRRSITVTFKDDKDGSERVVQAPVGQSLLEVAHASDVELEGACEGSLACSTCHVIVEQQEYYDRLPEPDDDENDMLDLAFGLTDT